MIFVYIVIAIIVLAVVINVYLYFTEDGSDTREQDKEFRDFKLKQEQEMARQMSERKRNTGGRI
jgi:uncharacterized membrane protein SpoIIM required for sporulation